MGKDKHICCNCKHFKEGALEDECMAHPKSEDYISGRTIYDSCLYHNAYGDCEKYEDSSSYKIRQFLENLLKKITTK